MRFENVMGLARETPTSVLCAAWAADADDVTACTRGERPMSIREAGALAEIHGLRLEDVLSV